MVTIITEKRSHDWIAFVAGNRGIWESRKTEMIAVGSPHKNHPELFGPILRKEARFDNVAHARVTITQHVGPCFRQKTMKDER